MCLHLRTWSSPHPYKQSLMHPIRILSVVSLAEFDVIALFLLLSSYARYPVLVTISVRL